MSSIAFDTHAFVKDLTRAGMTEEQAEVLARSQGDADRRKAGDEAGSERAGVAADAPPQLHDGGRDRRGRGTGEAAVAGFPPAGSGGRRCLNGLSPDGLSPEARRADLARCRRRRVRRLRGAVGGQPRRCSTSSPGSSAISSRRWRTGSRAGWGVCGSCAMTVNGRARWTCRSHVKDVAEGGRLVIEPLRNLPRIKDLVCDLAPFFDKWRRAGGRFEGAGTRREPMPAADPTRMRGARPTRASNASTARCAIAPATSSGGARTTSARPPSTAPGRWSTTNGTSRPGKSSTR